MKSVFTALLICNVMFTNAQHHILQKIWETDTVIAVPESVLPEKDILYVSLIDGAPWLADGKGGIAKLTPEGKIIDTAWITGLNAPKGLGVFVNRLFIADISEVVVADIANGRIEKKIKIDSALGLNDVTINDKGIVFVSDSRTAKIYRIENDAATLYLDNVQGVNGLKAIGDDLYILSGKSFMKADGKKNLTKITDLGENGDGLEPVGNGDFIATSWIGVVYYIQSDGHVETLLDTRSEKKNTADIGYNPAKRILYIPTFNGKQVKAYKLQ